MKKEEEFHPTRLWGCETSCESNKTLLSLSSSTARVLVTKNPLFVVLSEIEADCALPPVTECPSSIMMQNSTCSLQIRGQHKAVTVSEVKQVTVKTAKGTERDRREFLREQQEKPQVSQTEVTGWLNW